MENIDLVTKENCIRILEQKDFEGRCIYLNAIVNDESVDQSIIHIWTEAFDEVNAMEDQKVVDNLQEYLHNPYPNFDINTESEFKGMDSYEEYDEKAKTISKGRSKH